MGSVRIMGWISILMTLAIGGMGGAPLAEKFGPQWLTWLLLALAYGSVGLLAIAGLIVGGAGMYHGILVILGREVETFGSPRVPDPKPLPAIPRVEES